MNSMRSVAIAVTTVLAMSGWVLADTAVVSPANMGGWAFQLDASDGIGQMVTGPTDGADIAPPLGTGSARLNPGADGAYAAQIRFCPLNGQPLSSLTSLSYSSLAKQWNGQQLPYLIVNVDTNADNASDFLLAFEPAFQRPASGNPSLPDQGGEQLNTWQTWNALSGGWYDLYGGFAGAGTGVKPLSDFLASYPDAVITNQSSGAIRLVSGWASQTDAFDAYVDNVTIGMTSGSMTYNFEAVPEPATMSLLALGGLALIRRRRAAL